MLDGPAEDHQIGETRATILRWLRQAPGSTPKAIAEGTRIKPETVRQTCKRMLEAGQLSADTGGRYRVPGVTAVTPVTAVTELDLNTVNGSDADAQTQLRP